MRFEFRKPCECGFKGCDTRTTLISFRKFEIRYFNELGEWFLYIRWRPWYLRFSSAGFIKGKSGGFRDE